MPEHKIGTREEWQAARDELAKLEAEQAERDEEIKEKRRDLPGCPWRMSTCSRLRRARRPWPSSSKAARSYSPTTSCTGPTTRSERAPAAPASRTSSTALGSTLATRTSP